MAVDGELIGLGSITCEDCDTELPLQVCHSNAGYYLGHYCPKCGPYSRETDYFPTREKAETELTTILKIMKTFKTVVNLL